MNGVAPAEATTVRRRDARTLILRQGKIATEWSLLVLPSDEKSPTARSRLEPAARARTPRTPPMMVGLNDVTAPVGRVEPEQLERVVAPVAFVEPGVEHAADRQDRLAIAVERHPSTSRSRRARS